MAVVRGGISSRGLLMEVSSSADVIVAREEGSRGGSVWEEDASRIGVDVVEFSVDGGRTRFARKKEKKAAEQGMLAGDSITQSFAYNVPSTILTY